MFAPATSILAFTRKVRLMSKRLILDPMEPVAEGIMLEFCWHAVWDGDEIDFPAAACAFTFFIRPPSQGRDEIRNIRLTVCSSLNFIRATAPGPRRPRSSRFTTSPRISSDTPNDGPYETQSLAAVPRQPLQLSTTIQKTTHTPDSQTTPSAPSHPPKSSSYVHKAHN